MDLINDPYVLSIIHLKHGCIVAIYPSYKWESFVFMKHFVCMYYNDSLVSHHYVNRIKFIHNTISITSSHKAKNIHPLWAPEKYLLCRATTIFYAYFSPASVSNSSWSLCQYTACSKDADSRKLGSLLIRVTF